MIFSIDVIGLLFIVLTNLLIYLCVLYNYNNITLGLREVNIYLFLMQFFLTGLFLSTDLF